MNWILLGGSFLLGTAGALMMSFFAPVLGFLDLPCDRSSHIVPTPRGGGVGILLAAVCSALALKIAWLLWVPAVFLSIASLWDDRATLSPQVRLLLQAFAAIFTLPALAPPHAGPEWYCIVGLLWAGFLILTANFFNFMDGINGMSGISAAVGFGLVALFASLHEAEQWKVLLPSCLAVASLGFLPFNFPRPKVFLGDVGSVLLGFLFAVQVALLTRDAGSFLVLAGCLLPIYGDAGLTLIYRWRRGENLFASHRQHLYQVLVHKGGYPHWQVSLAYGICQLTLGLLLILAQQTWGSWFSGLLLLFVGIIFLYFANGIRKNSFRQESQGAPPGPTFEVVE